MELLREMWVTRFPGVTHSLLCSLPSWREQFVVFFVYFILFSYLPDYVTDISA